MRQIIELTLYLELNEPLILTYFYSYDNMDRINPPDGREVAPQDRFHSAYNHYMHQVLTAVQNYFEGMI